MKNQLVLIDGHALAYRMFFALPVASFTTKLGEPTNATYGFVRTILDLVLDENPPRYLAVCFDLGRTFRDELFADYKGTREKMPDELDVQIGRIKQVLETFNIPVLEVPGYEADDVLGTLARQAKEQNVPAYIITGDRDLLQLVDDNTRVELPPGSRQRRPQQFDVEAVQKKYELPPHRIVDLKALMGDSSDNIPGVYRVGEKTATKLLKKYETLAGVYEHLDEIKGAVKKYLTQDKENAYLSYQLAKIVTDAPIELDLSACVAKEFDKTAVLQIFRELEFRSHTHRLREADPELFADDDEWEEEEAPAETETITVRTEKQLEQLVETLNKAQIISFDVETSSLDKLTTDLVGICLAVKSPQAYYIPVGHLSDPGQPDSGQMSLFANERTLAKDQLLLDKVLAAIRPAMTNPDIAKVAHNAKFDYMVLAQHGLEVTPIAFDTMLAEWLTDPGSKNLGLKNLSYARLGVNMTEIQELIGKGSKQKSFAVVPIETAAPYGAADADITLRLMKKLQPELKQKGVADLLADLEMPLIPVLADMEQAGIGVDREVFAQMSRELSQRLHELEQKIHEIAGRPFNVNSTQQLSDVLFLELDLPHEGFRKTKSGHFSTAVSVLEDLLPQDNSGIVSAIMEYRELSKLQSTYVDALPQMINEETGRIHTSFNQTGAITGRIASNSPNLQNIPIRTEVGRQIRRGFVAPPGWVLLAADYSQVELRVLAHASQDEALLDAFRQDQDVHSTTAAAVYSVDLADVTFEQRRFAKAVNFGLIYGMGAFRLSRDSELTLAEAEDYIEEYFARFPGIQTYLDETKAKARSHGYVETLMGRRRYFPIFSGPNKNRQVEMRAEREAINYPIQGTAADIIKIAMIRLHRQLREGNYQARMLLQVHDELLLEVPDEELDTVQALVVDTMMNAYQLDVPLKVDSNYGRNWYEVKE